MRKIPHAHGVTQALRAAQKAVKKSLKGLNASAGQLMARGDYEGADQLAAKGRDLMVFQTEVGTLQKRWLELRSSGTAKGKRALTPLWEFYQPILKALEQHGGEGSVPDIAPLVERMMGPRFKAGDRIKLAGGKERWEVMIKRSRKHLVAEGWVEKRKGQLWRVTEAGKRAASNPLPQMQGRE